MLIKFPDLKSICLPLQTAGNNSGWQRLNKYVVLYMKLTVLKNFILIAFKLLTNLNNQTSEKIMILLVVSAFQSWFFLSCYINSQDRIQSSRLL